MTITSLWDLISVLYYLGSCKSLQNRYVRSFRFLLALFKKTAKRHYVVHYTNFYQSKEPVSLNAIGTTAAERINVWQLWTRKAFELIGIDTLPCKTSSIMHHRLHPYCTYLNVSFFNLRKQLAKCGFEKSRVITTCNVGNENSRALPVEYDMANLQGLMCAENDVSREHRIVENCEQEGNARACIYDLAEVIPKLWIVATRGKQNDLLTWYRHKTLDWMRYGRKRRTFLYVWNLYETRTIKFKKGRI